MRSNYQGKTAKTSFDPPSKSKMFYAKSPVPDMSYSSFSPHPSSPKGLFSPQSLYSLDFSFPDREKSESRNTLTQVSNKFLKLEQKTDDNEKKYMQEYIEVLKNRIKILTGSSNSQLFVNDEEIMKLKIKNSRLEAELVDKDRKILALQEEIREKIEENFKIKEKIEEVEAKSGEILENSEKIRGSNLHDDAFIRLKLEKVELIEKVSEMKKEIWKLKEDKRNKDQENEIFSGKKLKKWFEEHVRQMEKNFEKEIDKIGMQMERIEARVEISRKTVRFLQHSSLNESMKNKDLEKKMKEKSENFSKVITSRSQQLENQSEKLSKYEKELRSLKSALQSKEDKIEKLTEEIFQYSLAIEEQKAQYSKIAEKKDSESGKLLQSLEQLKESSSKTEEKMKSFDNTILEKNREILRLSGIIDDLRLENKQKSDEIQKKNSEIKGFEAEIKVFEVRVMHSEDQMRDMIKEKTKLQQVSEEKEKTNADLKSAALEQSRKISEYSVRVTKNKEKLQKTLNLLKDKEKELEKNSKFLESCQEQLNKKKDRVELLQRKIKDLESMLEQEKQKLLGFKMEEDKYKENQIRALSENYEKIVKEQEILIKQLNKKLAESEFEVQKIKEAERSEKENELIDLLTKLENEKIELNKELIEKNQAIFSLETENELFKAELLKAEAGLQRLSNENSELKSELRNYSMEKSELVSRIAEIQEHIREQDLVLDEKSELANRVQKLTKDLQAVTQKNSNLDKQLIEVQAIHLKEKAELQQEMQKLASNFSEKEKNLNKGHLDLINELKSQYNEQLLSLKSSTAQEEKRLHQQYTQKQDSLISENQRLETLSQDLKASIKKMETEYDTRASNMQAKFLLDLEKNKKLFLAEVETEKQLNQTLATKLDELINTKENLEKNLTGLTEIQEKLSQEIQDHEKTKKFLEDTLQKLETSTENYAQASSLFNQIKTKLDEKLEKMQEDNEGLAKDLKAVHDLNKSMEIKMKKLGIDLTNSESLQKSFEETLKSLEEANKELQDKSEKLEIEKFQLENKLIDTEKTYKEQESTISAQLNKGIIILTKLLSINPPDLESSSELSIKALYIISLSEKLESSILQLTRQTEIMKEKDAKIKELNKSIMLLNQEVNTLKQGLEKNKKIIEKKNTGIEKQESEIDSLKSKNTQLINELAESEESLKELSTELEIKEKALESLKISLENSEEEKFKLKNKLNSIECEYKAIEDKLKNEVKNANQALLKSQTTVNTIESSLRESLAKVSSSQYLIQDLQHQLKIQESEISDLKSSLNSSQIPKESSEQLLKLESELESSKKIIESLTSALNIPDKPHLTKLSSTLSESVRIIRSLTTLNYNSVEGRKEIFRIRDSTIEHLSLSESLQGYINALLKP